MTLWWPLDGPDDPDGSPSPPTVTVYSLLTVRPAGAAPPPLELLVDGAACDRGVLAGVAVAAATGSLSTYVYEREAELGYASTVLSTRRKFASPRAAVLQILGKARARAFEA